MRIVLKVGERLKENKDYIIGLPSHGNVGQLASDSIIATLLQASPHAIRKIGYIEAEDLLLPMAGYEIFSPGLQPELCLPMEVYSLEGTNWILLLQRSLCRKGCQKQFSNELLRLLTDQKSNSIMVLTGASTDDIELDTQDRLFTIANASGRKQMQLLHPTLCSVLDRATTLPFWELVYRSYSTPISAAGVSVHDSVVSFGPVSIDISARVAAVPIVENEFAGVKTPGLNAGTDCVAGSSVNAPSPVAATAAAIGMAMAVLPRGMLGTRCLLEGVATATAGTFSPSISGAGLASHTPPISGAGLASHTPPISGAGGGGDGGDVVVCADNNQEERVGGKEIPFVVLGRFCNEGDNCIDGLMLALEVLWGLAGEFGCLSTATVGVGVGVGVGIASTLVDTAAAAVQATGTGAGAGAGVQLSELKQPASWLGKFGASVPVHSASMFY